MRQIVPSSTSAGLLSDLIPDENWEVMQYIGLKDKNGVEIYEGDLVIFHAFKNTSTLAGYSEVDYNPIAQVFYNAETLSYMFKVAAEEIWDIFGTSHFESGDCIEVIGNVYENPELLEV